MALAPPLSWKDSSEHRRKIAQAVQQAQDGHTNNGGSVTLTASTTATVVTDRRCGTDSVVVFMAKTANAATALQNVYVSSRGDGTFTITHASSANVDQDFEYALLATGRSA